jgi:hypothetical protein
MSRLGDATTSWQGTSPLDIDSEFLRRALRESSPRRPLTPHTARALSAHVG